MKYFQNQIVYLLFVSTTLRNHLNSFYSVFSSASSLANSLYTHALLSCIPTIYLQDLPYYSAPSLTLLVF